MYIRTRVKKKKKHYFFLIVGATLKCIFTSNILFDNKYVKETHFSNLLHQHSEKKVLYK